MSVSIAGVVVLLTHFGHGTIIDLKTAVAKVSTVEQAEPVWRLITMIFLALLSHCGVSLVLGCACIHWHLFGTHFFLMHIGGSKVTSRSMPNQSTPLRSLCDPFFGFGASMGCGRSSVHQLGSRCEYPELMCFFFRLALDPSDTPPAGQGGAQARLGKGCVTCGFDLS